MAASAAQWAMRPNSRPQRRHALTVGMSIASETARMVSQQAVQLLGAMSTVSC
ncbi:hypothetical protein [Verminephrobacter eiseniae]|uniref:hypothetical protein n=1 Tax=Verminephrobacter eiseniae TaxID=364317 RepID=UPI0022377434|nr:hypothetical protein [Verminephrobacter eiseniae]